MLTGGSPHRSLAAIGLAILIMSPACARDPQARKQRSFEKGEAFFAARRYADASIEYRKALQIDPQFGRARLRLAEAYAATNDLRAAYAEYIRAADLMPGDMDVQVKAGNMLLLGKRFQEAKERARAVLRADPNNFAGLVLLGNALAGLKDLDSAVSVTERATRLDPLRAGAFANLGALQLARGDREAAERAFARAVELNPTKQSAWLSQANFYVAVNEVGRAEESFRRALELDRTDIRSRRSIARFYIDSNRPSAAEPHLRFVAETQQQPSAWIDLADLYFTMREYRRADDVLAGLTVAPDNLPTFSEVRVRLALVAAAERRLADAHAILAELVQRNAHDSVALALGAQLLLAENRLDDALAQAQAAVQADAASSRAHYILGTVFLARDDYDNARKAFNAALTLEPTAADIKLQLARIHLARREVDSAIQFADQTVTAQPDNLEAHLTLARTLTARRDDRERARTVISDLLGRYPTSAAVHNIAGEFYLQNGADRAARTEFERAVQLQSNSVDALGSLIAMDLGSARPDAARARLDRSLAAHPNDPGLLLLNAKLALTLRDVKDAELRLRQLIHADPSTLDGYTLLGQLFVAERRLPEATAEFAELARRNPRSVAALIMMGLLMHAQGKIPEAITWYAKAVDVDPRKAAPAANNLAWLYSASPDKLDLALQLALTARSALPDSPQINDTLGWIYYKKRALESAVRYLQQSADKDPGNPLYQFHLGMAYAQQGDDARARRLLESALKTNPQFEGADEARKTLASLVY